MVEVPACPPRPTDLRPMAWFGGWLATELAEVSDDPGVLDGRGRWAVQVDYEGRFRAARFSNWQRGPTVAQLDALTGDWVGPNTEAWTSSLDCEAYQAAVQRVRAHIEAGEVYQANITRVLRAALPVPAAADPLALGRLLQAGNPAPHAGVLRVPGIAIACASPEMFLRRTGTHIASRPIKGTGVVAGDLLEKDHAENVMIVDLVRNDLARVCVAGSVAVPELCVTESHPGLVHLVSEVSGVLRPNITWPEILAATFPAGSITGAPKLAACRIIAELESGPRGPYCGAFGWVDADTRTAELAVAIRTFWLEWPSGVGHVAFGTGAGITWGSEPRREWQETQLKAARLVALAAAASGHRR